MVKNGNCSDHKFGYFSENESRVECQGAGTAGGSCYMNECWNGMKWKQKSFQ